MDDLVFACNVVLPIILLIGLGYFLKKIKVVDQNSLNNLNKLCFNLFLPISLFISIYDTESISDINYTLMGFVGIFLLIIFFVGLLFVKLFVKDNRQKGVILQDLFRSNFAIIGIPLATMIAGEEGTKVAAIVTLINVPLNNILATIALTMFTSKEKEHVSFGKIIIKIIKNPLIIAVIGGIAILIIRKGFEYFGINFRINKVTFLYDTIKMLSKVTTPLALITAGGLFEFSFIKNMKKQVIWGSLGKLVFVPLIVFTTALLFFDFLPAEYATLIACFASPAAVSSAIMAKEMDNDGDLANQILIWSTIGAAVTIFLIIYIFRLIQIF